MTHAAVLMQYPREAIAKARLLPAELLSAKAADPHRAARSAPGDLSFGAYLVPEVVGDEGRAGTARQKALSVPALGLERETGFEPATLSLGS
jgi:hypothetical protein